MKEIDFENDNFADIISMDPRYSARAYAFLLDVVIFLAEEVKGHVSAAEILDEFKDYALDQYGPMAYTVLSEWGLSTTDDVGEMMVNLVEHKRLVRRDEDNYSDFNGVYDFKEVFLDPYQT